MIHARPKSYGVGSASDTNQTNTTYPFFNVPFYFGGTSLLIIVVVTMDFWAQVQSYVMSQQYESLLKKANFKAG